MINHIFPTLLYSKKLSLNENYKKQLLEKIVLLSSTVPKNSDWRCDTWSSLNIYDLKNDILWQNLITVVTEKVLDFAKEFGVSNRKCILTDAWANVANQGNFQEYHIHTGSHFSIVYYLQVGNDCGNIIFRSFEADTDMLPLPADILTYPNYKTMSIMPEEDNLLIFRSNLKHMVEKNISNVQRISLSMNFLFT